MEEIERFAWTVHADERLFQRGLTRARVERAIRSLHPIRESNVGEAGWRVDAGSFVVVYIHPDGNDARAARIISVWAKRRPNRRRSEDYPG